MSDPVPARSPILLFDSIHAVLAAERALQAGGVACDLVPVPRGLSSDCGMAVLIGRDDLERARVILDSPRHASRFRGVYVPGPAGYERGVWT